MIFKKNNITINSNRIPIDRLKECFSLFPKNLPPYLSSMPSLIDPKIPISKTVRHCPGMINLFKNTILFNSPFDIHVNFEDDGSWNAFVGSGGMGNNTVNAHDDNQLLNFVNSPYKLLLKFHFEIIIQCDYAVYLTNPWWHFKPYETIPGYLNCKEPVELNFFVPIRKELKVLKINYGDPLMHLNVEHKDKLNIKFNKKKINHWSELQYRFSTLKNKLFKNKFTPDEKI
jgi:hypothetical protein|tara:strand:- start:1258 stop:1944 length:687 start_codon:yes stop_codon:yes gene_type:complete